MLTAKGSDSPAHSLRYRGWSSKQGLSGMAARGRREAWKSRRARDQHHVCKRNASSGFPSQRERDWLSTSGSVGIVARRRSGFPAYHDHWEDAGNEHCQLRIPVDKQLVCRLAVEFWLC